MSLHWTLIAGFLYIEIAIVLLLVLPIFSPQRWNRILNSNFMKALKNQARYYFMLVFVVLLIFLLDAVREMRKYSNADTHEHQHSHLDAEMQANMRLFRAQRNFYISGFTLFLSLVIRRLLILVSQQAQLIAQSEAAMKQAKGATAAARSFLNQKSSESEGAKDEITDEKVKSLEEKVANLEKELATAISDRDAVKSQAASVTKEYDRLLEEHRKVQKSISASGDKKRE